MSSAADAATKRDLHMLAERVHAYWVDGVLSHSLDRSTLFDLAKQFEPEAVHDPWTTILEVPGRDDRVLPAGYSTDGVFDEAGHSLLILGEPGSGKTTTLLGLTQTLIDRFRNDDDDAAVPVVLNLATWSPTHVSFTEWVVNELRDKYQIPAKLARSWVVDRRLILLLDGLDETRESVRGSCVEAINDFLTSVGVPGIALCCRAHEYSSIGVLLRLRAALRILPLSPVQVDAWLASRGDAVQTLRVAITRNAELGRMAEVPLMLSVMAAVAVEAPQTFAKETPQEGTDLRDALFRTYVLRMLRRRGRKSSEKDQQVLLQCLGVLARGMRAHSQSIFLVERLQPSWLRHRVLRIAYLLLSRMVGAAAMTTAYVLFGLSLFGENELGGAGALFIALLLSLVIRDVLLSRRFTSSAMRRVQHGFAKFRGVPGLAVLMSVLWMAGDYVSTLLNLQHDGLEPGIVSYAIFLSVIAALPFPPSTPGHELRQDIVTVDTLRWSWRSALRGAFLSWAASFSFFTLSCAGALADGTSFSRQITSAGPYLFALPLSLVFALAGGLVMGSTKGVVADSTGANQGIRMSLRYATMMFALMFLVESAPMALALHFLDDRAASEMVADGMLGSLSLAIMGWLYFGGFEAVKHYLLRALLLMERTLPGRLPRALNYASDLILLRRVGAGYVFMHRMLLEYFLRPDHRLADAPTV